MFAEVKFRLKIIFSKGVYVVGMIFLKLLFAAKIEFFNSSLSPWTFFPPQGGTLSELATYDLKCYFNNVI